VAEAWGTILRFLGTILNGIYSVIPSYALAIILLTLLVRVVLIPLTVKQIRSMSAMQKIQPELKKLQQKYKGDRQKLNEEMMKLYREHGVNPLGGCFPLLMQAPVFIALYSVLRAAVPAPAIPVAGTNLTLENLPAKRTICRPVNSTATTTHLRCEVDPANGKGNPTVHELDVQTVSGGGPLPSYITYCPPGQLQLPDGKKIFGFGCKSPVGTGHLPREGDRFDKGSLGDAIVKDRATFLGMHLACSPTQATNKAAIRQCTAAEDASGGAGLVAYFALVALMMGSTYYQQKQMSAQATGPQAKQMQMMGRIMPLFLGFISLNIPSGVIIYWIVSNGWTIGQQYFFLQRQHPASGGAPSGPAGKTGDGADGKGRPPMKKPQPKPKRKR
jgi:YidC/Oxa1 family membrane protein insertase